MKLSPFGKWIRTYRMEIGENLGDMAEKLGISSSFLSAVEIGHKTISTKLISTLMNVYNLASEQADELLKLAKLANKEFRIPVSERNFEAIELLARRASSLTQEEITQIKLILNKPAKKKRTTK